MMSIGFCILLGSLCLHAFLIKRLDKLCGPSSSSSGYSRSLLGVNFGYVIVLIRACSFLSNSFILEEGRVACFLLATTALLQLRYAALRKKMLLDTIALCLLVPLLRIGIELGQLKQAVNSLFLKVDSSKTLEIDNSHIWMYFAEVLPILALTIVAYLVYKSIIFCSSEGILKYVAAGSLFNYLFIPIQWASDSGLLILPFVLGGKSLIPRATYVAGLLQLCLAIGQQFIRTKSLNVENSTSVRALALLSAWSSTIIILSGKQGPLVLLAVIIGGWCIIRLMTLSQDAKNGSAGSSHSYALSVTQWSLLAICIFFSSGHWCAFDGLRYAAAFVGFDEFNLIRQAILLSIDTFGLSHILPIVGLPLIVAYRYPRMLDKRVFSMRLCQVYLMYGLFTALTVTFTMLCVTIQRRHLMVWGLFAPKFVFDAVGLLLTDFLILFSSLYYVV